MVSERADSDLQSFSLGNLFSIDIMLKAFSGFRVLKIAVFLRRGPTHYQEKTMISSNASGLPFNVTMVVMS